MVLSDARLYAGYMPAALPLGLQGEAVDLVIERCSESYRMTLPPPVTEAVIVTDITTDGDSYRGTVTTPAGTTGTHAETRYGLGGRACHTASTERWTVGADPAPGMLHVGAIRAHEPVTTPWGVADVWTLARSPTTSVLVPLTELAPGRWRVGVTTPPTWSVWVDGEPFVDQRWQGLAWELLMTPDGPLHQLTGGAYFVYEAGATTDRLRVLLTNGWHSADLPHVTPSNELAFSLADDGRFELAVGPVTLTNESEPSLTRELAFTVAWDHAVIPRPVP
ncbi:MAG: hypothetical protein F9K40_20475 [Kofleriaceae bacterium]|nr:MAG: hypothetical protein F9K40_20475 [Kofleriaceae bacterium]